MTSEQTEKLQTCVSAAARIASIGEASRKRHLDQLRDESDRILSLFEQQKFSGRLVDCHHTYNTEQSQLVQYALKFEFTNTGELPKSSHQLKSQCQTAGFDVKSIDYEASNQTYTIVFGVEGQAVPTRRSRRLREEEPLAAVYKNRVPDKVARLLDNDGLDHEMQAHLGVARGNAVRSLKIRKGERFSKQRSKPKPAIAKPIKHHKAGAADAEPSEKLSIFSFKYWFGGGGGGGDQKALVEAYKDEHKMFTYVE